VTRSTISYEINGRHHVADMYQPVGQVRAGIVLAHGAVALGKDDPRLRDFARVLARARFAVLVPDIVDLRQHKLLLDSALDIGDAFAYLVSRTNLAPGDRAGIGAFSVAVGPALLAALDPSIADRVGFILSVGGYYDLPRTLTYFTTGFHEAYGIRYEHSPVEYAKWVIAASNTSRLTNARDREIFSMLVHRKLSDPKAEVNDLISLLSASGEAVYAFIVNTDPSLAPTLLTQLPSAVRDEIRGLDLASQDLSRLNARLLLIHGMDDTVIPYTESKALAKAVQPDKVRLFLLRGLQHVDTVPSAMDAWRLLAATRALLSERAK
jgi:dienelactone hydrolase